MMDPDEDGSHFITDELLDLVEHNPYLYPRLHACIKSKYYPEYVDAKFVDTHDHLPGYLAVIFLMEHYDVLKSNPVLITQFYGEISKYNITNQWQYPICNKICGNEF
jgi:hypothetical protein